MLYHYTNLQGLLGILSGQSLWASHCEYLNDSSEYRQAIHFAKSFSGGIFMEDDYLSAFGWTVREALGKELWSNLVYEHQAVFLSDCSITCSPSWNLTLLTTRVSS